MQSNKGITLISIAIVIVIVAIIASFSLVTSRDVVVEGNMTKSYNEIKSIKDAVELLSLDDSYQDTILKTTQIDNVSEYNPRVGNNLVSGKKYYYLGYGDSSIGDTMKESLNEVLDVRSIEKSYIVAINDVADVEVYVVDGVRYGDNTYFSFEEIFDAYGKASK